MKSTAKVREKEKERIFEKKLLKERKEEDEKFGDQEKFVTSAYKQKMLEAQKWEYEDKCVLKLFLFLLSIYKLIFTLKPPLFPLIYSTFLSARLQEQLEQSSDVRKQGMQGFYANLLTKNISMGVDVSAAGALSAYTAGSTRQKASLEHATSSTSPSSSSSLLSSSSSSSLPDSFNAQTQVSESKVACQVLLTVGEGGIDGTEEEEEVRARKMARIDGESGSSNSEQQRHEREKDLAASASSVAAAASQPCHHNQQQQQQQEEAIDPVQAARARFLARKAGGNL